MEEPIKVSVYCIIENEGKILLTEDEGKSGWKLSGGEVKKGELLLDAAIREVKEETGFDIKISAIVAIEEYIKENGEHRIRVYTQGTLIGGDAKLMAGEVKKLEWISLETVKNFTVKDFYLETYYQAIRDYLSGKSYPTSLIKTRSF